MNRRSSVMRMSKMDGIYLKDVNWKCVKEFVGDEDSVLGGAARDFRYRVVPMKVDRTIVR